MRGVLQAESKTLRAVVDEEEKEMDKEVAHATNAASISMKEVPTISLSHLHPAS